MVNFKEFFLLRITDLSSIIKAIGGLYFVKKCLADSHNKPKLFKPSDYLAQHASKYSDITIIAGSYALKDHIRHSNDFINKDSCFTISVNISAISGHKVNLAFWELWDKNKTRDWFENSYLRRNPFEDLTKSCDSIVITRISKHQVLPSKMLSIAQPNLWFACERSIHAKPSGTSLSFLTKKLRSYLDASIKSITWRYFVPSLRASIIRALLFACKLRPKRIIICGLSEGKNSLHFFDNNNDYPHLKEVSDKYIALNPEEVYPPHRTNNPKLGNWTALALISLINTLTPSTQIFIANKSGIHDLNKCTLPDDLDEY